MIRFVLKGRTNQLSAEDLSMITELAQKFHPTAHISHGAWHVLVGIPNEYHQKAVEIIQSRQYECYVFSGATCKLFTFVLRKKNEGK